MNSDQTFNIFFFSGKSFTIWSVSRKIEFSIKFHQFFSYYSQKRPTILIKIAHVYLDVFRNENDIGSRYTLRGVYLLHRSYNHFLSFP